MYFVAILVCCGGAPAPYPIVIMIWYVKIEIYFVCMPHILRKYC